MKFDFLSILPDRPTLVVPVALCALALTYWLDLVFPPYVSFTAFYLIPIALVGWHTNVRVASAVTLLAIIADFHNSILLNPVQDSRLFQAFEAISNSLLYGVFLYGIVRMRKLMANLQDKSHLLGRLAFHDRLTDLPNRPLLFDRLALAIAQAKRNKRLVALLFLDLDDFKPVNDQYGHKAGDVVLKAVAARFLSCVRETDTVARIGGDEFAIVLNQVDDANTAAAVAGKILQAFALPVDLGNGLQHVVGVSIGISLYPDNGSEIDRLLANADEAMYESKRLGRHRYVFTTGLAVDQKINDHWMAFSPDHAVGVAEIDQQHRQLMHQVNRLNDVVRGNEPLELINRLFDELVSYTQFHFASEERLMHQYNFPGEESHQREHSYLVEEVGYIKQQFGNGGELIALQTIKDWLVMHIEHSDKGLGIYLRKHGVS